MLKKSAMQIRFAMQLLRKEKRNTMNPDRSKVIKTEID